MSNELDNDALDSVDSTLESPEEMDHKREMVAEDRSACRDATTGRFTKGWKGGGRPVGSKDRFSKRVLDTLEACWEANADEMLTQLAAEKPEVIMGMIAKLMPANLIQEDITGITADSNTIAPEVTIRLVNKVEDDTPALPREVEGELLPYDTKH